MSDHTRVIYYTPTHSLTHLMTAARLAIVPVGKNNAAVTNTHTHTHTHTHVIKEKEW